MCQEFGIDSGDEIIPRIASLFAGGIGNSGSVCGAVTGAVMAMGLVGEQAETVEEMLENLAAAREFRRRFENEMGTIQCRELTGLDLTKIEDMQELGSSDIPREVCFPAVMTAYRLVVEMLR